MDKNDIINYVMHTPHNTNRAVLSSMLNQLTKGGSGGSSDFSTAEVTVYDVSQGTLFSAIDAPGPGAPVVISTCDIESGITYTVALYKGYAIGQIPPATSVSGNIEIVDELGDCLITGDCTIGTVEGE